MSEQEEFKTVIDQFGQHAAALSLQSAPPGAYEATLMLAKWIAQESRWLSKTDKETLYTIGGIYLRDQMMQKRSNVI